MAAGSVFLACLSALFPVAGAISCVNYIPVSAVSVQVEQLVKGQKVPVAEQTVTEGQKIKLTCVPTCAASLNSDPAYIWYKNRRQLSGSGATTSLLSLDPIGSEDTGSYSCAAIDYEDLRSSAVDLSVRYGPRNTAVSVEISCGVTTLTCRSDANPPVHEYTWYRRSAEGEEEVLQKSGRKDFTVDGGFRDNDTYLCQAANDISAQNSTAQNLSRNLTDKHKHTCTLLKILVASVSVGLVVVITVSGAFLVVKMKKRGAGPVPEPRDTDTYLALDISSTVTESRYDTLTNVRGCTANKEDGIIYVNYLSTC